MHWLSRRTHVGMMCPPDYLNVCWHSSIGFLSTTVPAVTWQNIRPPYLVSSPQSSPIATLTDALVGGISFLGVSSAEAVNVLGYSLRPMQKALCNSLRSTPYLDLFKPDRNAVAVSASSVAVLAAAVLLYVGLYGLSVSAAFSNFSLGMDDFLGRHHSDKLCISGFSLS